MFCNCQHNETQKYETKTCFKKFSDKTESLLNVLIFGKKTSVKLTTTDDKRTANDVTTDVDRFLLSSIIYIAYSFGVDIMQNGSLKKAHRGH